MCEVAGPMEIMAKEIVELRTELRALRTAFNEHKHKVRTECETAQPMESHCVCEKADLSQRRKARRRRSPAVGVLKGRQ